MSRSWWTEWFNVSLCTLHHDKIYNDKNCLLSFSPISIAFWSVKYSMLSDYEISNARFILSHTTEQQHINSRCRAIVWEWGMPSATRICNCHSISLHSPKWLANTSNCIMIKLDKLRYGWTDKPCFKRWWTSLQGESFTVLNTASLFSSIEASSVLFLSPFHEQKMAKNVLNLCVT